MSLFINGTVLRKHVMCNFFFTSANVEIIQSRQLVCRPFILSVSTPSSNVPLIPPSSLHRYQLLSFWSTVLYRLITDPPKSLGSLLITYSTTLSSLLDKHAPVITKFDSRKSKSNPWFTSTHRTFKSKVCHAENIWKHSLCSWLVLFHISL